MIENFSNGKGFEKDDGGFFHDDAEHEKKMMETETSRALAERENKPNTSYYIFRNQEERDRALALVDAYRQVDDTFTFLEDSYGHDSGNPAGLKLDFSRSSENQNEKVKGFFQRLAADANIEEVYKVSDGVTSFISYKKEGPEGEPSEQAPKRDNVLPFPGKNTPDQNPADLGQEAA